MSVERVFAEQEAVLRRRLRRMTGDAQAAEHAGGLRARVAPGAA
jgi:hypothetical protein